MADAFGSLKQMAARAGVRIRPANLVVRGADDYFTVSCSFNLGAHRLEVYANPRLLFVGLNCDSRVIFSTPRQDPDSNLMLLLGRVAGGDVYVNGQGLRPPGPWIYSTDVVATLESLELRNEEMLTVMTNGLHAILRSAGPDGDWKRLQRLVALARILPPGTKEAALDRQRLPEDLRDLFPLLKRWGTSDDQERSDRVERANTETLRRLLETAESRLPRIAEFLSQEGGDSAEGAALDGLAQAVMEARQELNIRA